MRAVATIAAVLLAGCVHQEAAQPKTVTKVVHREKIVEKLVYACRPEPVGGCNDIKELSACLAHKRCQWAQGDAVRGYCRRIYCRD